MNPFSGQPSSCVDGPVPDVRRQDGALVPPQVLLRPRQAQGRRRHRSLRFAQMGRSGIYASYSQQVYIPHIVSAFRNIGSGSVLPLLNDESSQKSQ